MLSTFLTDILCAFGILYFMRLVWARLIIAEFCMQATSQIVITSKWCNILKILMYFLFQVFTGACTDGRVTFVFFKKKFTTLKVRKGEMLLNIASFKEM